ncbi:MAG TPA: type I methionyl aminopeptidase [Myxococcota bacterium]|nr:type I methionyl aminopeptidase [Myxococcota bacterium]
MNRSEFLAAADLDLMRRSCELAAETLLMIGEHIQAGISTEEINTLVHEFIVRHEAYPSPLNYRGFPKSVCTSINEVVCHGIPTPDAVLKNGDIVNVDVTTYFPARDGFHGDTSATFYVGDPGPMARHVVEVARQALEIGIAAVEPDKRIGDIGHAIQQFVESKGCSVVRDYTGHGIGRAFHSEPSVPHFGRPNHGPRIRKGMIFTIEPMVNLGSPDTELLGDHWTVVARDRSLSAQFEHTILVTRNGSEVLTRRNRPLKNSETFAWARLGPRSCHIPPGGPAAG